MPVIDNNDLLIIIQEMFLGYMERKKSNTLYRSIIIGLTKVNVI